MRRRVLALIRDNPRTLTTPEIVTRVDDGRRNLRERVWSILLLLEAAGNVRRLPRASYSRSTAVRWVMASDPRAAFPKPAGQA